MSLSRKCCVNHPGVFCYICGEYAFKENRKTIIYFVKRVYLEYFCSLSDQDKSWALNQSVRRVKFVKSTYDSGVKVKETV